MVSHVGNFSCKSANGVSPLSVIVGVMWRSKVMHQLVSDGHVDNVGRSQLELECVDVDVTQNKSNKVILRILAVLYRCRQQIHTRTGSMVLTCIPEMNSLSDLV